MLRTVFSRLNSVVFVATGAFAVAACGDAGPQTVKEFAFKDPWSQVIHASSKGPIFVDVMNNPFRISDSDLKNKITAKFGAGIKSRVMTYTVDANAAPASKVFKVVIAFNAASDALGDGLCRGEVTSSRPSGTGGLDVLGIVCVDGANWVQVRGLAKDVTEPTGQFWDILMGKMIREMFGKI